jgi:hypothetical protein
MAYCSGMRLFYWLLLAFLSLCAFAAPGQEWIGWALVISLWAVLMMVDAMFFSSPADFAFDPNVRGGATPLRPRARGKECWLGLARARAQGAAAGCGASRL